MSSSIYTRGKTRPSYYVQTGSMYENPFGAPEEEIKELEKSLPPEMVAQVVYGRYVDASGLVFPARLIAQALDGEEIRTGFWKHKSLTPVWGEPGPIPSTRGPQYIAAVDLARKTDYTVLMVFAASGVPEAPAEMVWYERLNRVSWDAIYASIGRVSALFGVEVIVDATGMGGDVVETELQGRFYCRPCHASVPFALTNGEKVCPKCGGRGHRIDVDGFQFTGRVKEQLITRLQSAMSYGEGVAGDGEWGLLRLPRIEQVVDELAFYRLDDKQLVTDCVMTLGMVAWQLEFEESEFALGSPAGGGYA